MKILSRFRHTNIVYRKNQVEVWEKRGGNKRELSNISCGLAFASPRSLKFSMPFLRRVTATQTTTIPTMMTTMVAITGTSTLRSSHFGHQSGSQVTWLSIRVGGNVAANNTQQQHNGLPSPPPSRHSSNGLPAVFAGEGRGRNFRPLFCRLLLLVTSEVSVSGLAVFTCVREERRNLR